MINCVTGCALNSWCNSSCLLSDSRRSRLPVTALMSPAPPLMVNTLLLVSNVRQWLKRVNGTCKSSNNAGTTMKWRLVQIYVSIAPAHSEITSHNPPLIPLRETLGCCGGCSGAANTPTWCNCIHIISTLPIIWTPNMVSILPVLPLIPR